jgi:crotonobetainyl-CoA:carnitine CoA-transferase CaiB-like acyl-CoA transferase
VLWQEHTPAEPKRLAGTPERPFAGLKVLDLTRVLAGPVAGRVLAAYGANVLRIDPRDWDEAAVVPEVTLGKRCAGLNLKDPTDKAQFEKLLAEADVLLHGYRAEALPGLGYDADSLRRINPKLIDVSLNAYGWSGPWRARRGFDSLLQMSSGIAEFGMRKSGAEKPTPLPVQALDHATGYLLAAAVAHAVREQATRGTVLSAKLSLARTALLLSQSKRWDSGPGMAVETADDIDPSVEHTHWGPARRIKFPLRIAGTPHSWVHPASGLRTAAASF